MNLFLKPFYDKGLTGHSILNFRF